MPPASRSPAGRVANAGGNRLEPSVVLPIETSLLLLAGVPSTRTLPYTAGVPGRRLAIRSTGDRVRRPEDQPMLQQPWRIFTLFVRDVNAGVEPDGNYRAGGVRLDDADAQSLRHVRRILDLDDVGLPGLVQGQRVGLPLRLLPATRGHELHERAQLRVLPTSSFPIAEGTFALARDQRNVAHAIPPVRVHRIDLNDLGQGRNRNRGRFRRDDDELHFAFDRLFSPGDPLPAAGHGGR